MIPILLALLSCFAYGISDYLQGIASRKYASGAIMIAVQVAGLATIAVVLPLAGGKPLLQDYIWGSTAGLALLVAVALLIYAFRNGPITIAAPVMGVVDIIVPAMFSIIVRGNPVDASVGSGLVLAIAAIVLVNHQGEGRERLKPLPLIASILSGAAFGVFAIVFSLTSPGAGLWPLVFCYILRMILLLVVLAIAGKLRPSLAAIDCGLFKVAGAAGIIVTFASAMYVISLELGGVLVVSSTMISEAPVITILLAMIVGRERINRLQTIGIVASMLSMALIGLG